MSLFQEVETTNYNIFEDFSNLNEGYNSIANECDYINIDLKEEENKNNNDSLIVNNNKKQEIDNEKFLKFFMNIDYQTDFLNDSSAKEFSYKINYTDEHKNEKNFKKENDISTQSQLCKKTQREKDNGILYDELTNITYIEKDDPIAFRKAKKRIQNRESALRIKKIRQMNLIKNENEIELLQKENDNLKIENSNLKKEKIFLIEQIKVMQNILNDSKIEFSNKIGKIKEYENNEIYYDGSKQKIKGKLFNIFVICFLSMVYIIGESNSNESSFNNSRKNISMNSINPKNNTKKILWNLISKIILIIIVLLIIPLIKSLCSLPYIISNNKKKYV
jgi:hypothetical protein